MNTRVLETAVSTVQQAGTAVPADLGGMMLALGDLDELFGVLSSYARRMSTVAEGLPDRTEGLRVNELDIAVPPASVCNQVAIHLQAAAAGIDQARSAVRVAHQLGARLEVKGP